MNDFKLRDVQPSELFGQSDLQEGLVDTAQLASSVMATPENLGKLISQEVPLLKIGMLIFRLFRNKNLSTLQKINRGVFAIGPISILVIYMFLGQGALRTIAELFIKHIVANLAMNKFMKILVRFIFKLADKGRQSVMAIFISMFLLPIGAFFTMIGGLLLKGDQEAQNILRRQDIYWMKECLKLFKMISVALLETIPFLKPIIQFITVIFQKIGIMFKSGKTAAQKAVKKAQQESMQYSAKHGDLQESIISSSIIIGSISIFFMKILKSTKIIGILGLVIVVATKFFPGIKQILMKIPLIGPMITMSQTVGKSLSSRFGLNKAANELNNVQKESQELQSTVQVMSAITH